MEKFSGWVCLLEKIGYLTEGSVGKIFNERNHTYLVCFYSTQGIEIISVPKSIVAPYSIEDELRDLSYLLFEAKQMNDTQWFGDLKGRYDLLKRTCEALESERNKEVVST